MIKLIDLLEASKTSTTQGSEEMGGYSGFVKPEEFESYKKWIAKSLKVQLVEGIQDKGIFKAVFLAGGPGSGKSYVVARTTKMFGMRVVNSDDVLLKDAIKSKRSLFVVK